MGTFLFLTIGWVPMALAGALASMIITVPVGAAAIASMRAYGGRGLALAAFLVATVAIILWEVLVLRSMVWARVNLPVATWALWIGAVALILMPGNYAIAGVKPTDPPETHRMAAGYSWSSVPALLALAALVFHPALRPLWSR